MAACMSGQRLAVIALRYDPPPVVGAFRDDIEPVATFGFVTQTFGMTLEQ